MASVKITQDNFENEVLHSDIPVIVDFWAQWCGPCRMLSPVLEEISDENSEVKVCKVNVDEEADLAEQFNVMSIPTVILFKNGKPEKTSVGVKPKEWILSMLDE